jgi:hypothetical protein
MRTLHLICWTIFLLGIVPATAHDIGMITLRFEELGENRYQLEYIAQPGSPESAAPPVLSPPLTWEQEPELPGGLVRLVFATDGKPLSSEDRITLPWRVNGVMVQAFWRSGETARHLFPLTKEGVVIQIGDLRAGTGSMGEAAKHYTQLGVKHVLTGGEHLLFLVGLMLLMCRQRAVAAAVGALIAGHSLSLAFAIFGRVNVNIDVLDSLMLLSILILAVELIQKLTGHSGLTSQKPVLAFISFGVIHGLGFAAALSALGLPRQELPVAGGFFNLGIILGELGVMAVWHVVSTVLDKGLTFRLPERLVQAPAYALGIVAAYLFIDQTMTMF